MSAMAKHAPPFRAEHVGSLLRPARLRRAFREVSEGAIDEAAFARVQDECIREIVRLQEDAGLRVVTDGEFRRKSYWSHFVEAVEGLDVATARFDFRDESGATTAFLAPHVIGPVRRRRSICGNEYDFLRAATPVTPKVTLPSPPTMHFWAAAGAAGRAGYRDDAAYLADLAEVYRAEIADLASRGATYIQIDEVPLAMLCDPALRARLEASGEDPQDEVARYVGLINACIGSRPPGVTVGVHLCRGNFKGRWLAEGGYGYVAERLFNDIEADVFFLEYDTERAGGFEPLAALPPEKTAVLGLVSTKTAVLEPPGDLARRIEEASRYASLDRLALSPQCGFASTVAGNPVSEATQAAKLRLVAEVARTVWNDA